MQTVIELIRVIDVMAVVARQGIAILAFVLLVYMAFLIFAGKLFKRPAPRDFLTVSVEEFSRDPVHNGKVQTGTVKHGGKTMFKVAGEEMAWIDYDAVTNSIWLKLKVARPEVIEV